jgi:hypothetical protein
MSESKVFMFDDSDPEMQNAYLSARANFRYFWREVAWERRRIIPALDLACAKAPLRKQGGPKPFALSFVPYDRGFGEEQSSNFLEKDSVAQVGCLRDARHTTVNT